MSILDIFRRIFPNNKKKVEPFTIQVSHDVYFDGEIYVRIVLKPGWKISSTIPIMNNFVIGIVREDAIEKVTE